MLANRVQLRLPNVQRLIFIAFLSIVLLITTLQLGTSAEDEAPTPFLVGTGDFAFTDGIYYEAEFRFPYGIVYDEGTDSLLIADMQNHRIRQMDMETFEVTTLAGTSNLVDRFGFPAGGHIDGTAEDAMFNRPRGLAVAPNGSIFVADTGNHSIRQVYDGNVFTVAGSGDPGHKDDNGLDAQFWNPTGIVIDSKGNIFISDTLNHVIRKMDEEGNVTTYAGEPGNTTLFNEPTGLAIDKNDVIYVADSANHQIKKIENGVITVIAGLSTEIDVETDYLLGEYANGKGSEARFNFPKGITLADNGFLYIADSWNHAIRAITPEGRVYTVAGAGVSGFDWDEQFTVRFDGPIGITYSLGNLFITDYWNNRVVVIPATRDYLRPIIDFSAKKASIPVFIDGSELDFPDVQPFIIDDRVRVPVRFIAEEWGADVRWDADRRAVVVTRGAHLVEFHESTEDFFIHDSRSMVELRTLSEKLGLYIDWNEEHRSVIIETYTGF